MANTIFEIEVLRMAIGALNGTLSEIADMMLTRIESELLKSRGVKSETVGVCAKALKEQVDRAMVEVEKQMRPTVKREPITDIAPSVANTLVSGNGVATKKPKAQWPYVFPMSQVSYVFEMIVNGVLINNIATDCGFSSDERQGVHRFANSIAMKIKELRGLHGVERAERLESYVDAIRERYTGG